MPDPALHHDHIKEVRTNMETLIDRQTPTRSWARLLGTGAAALLAAGIVGSSAAAGAAATANAPTGASGSVAALGTSSMEVQNPSSGQTTVNWTSTTTFSKSITESVGAIAVGDCVTATGSASKKSKTTISARSITLTMPDNTGACRTSGGRGANGFRFGTGSGGPPAGGFQFRTGTGAGGSGSARPSFPKGGPPGNVRQQFANLDIASGKVTAVNGLTITLSGTSISPSTFTQRGKPSSKSKKPTTPKTETLKITTSSSTPVNTTQTVASSALAVGDCVSAFGPAASNGSVTATTVRITSTGGGNCNAGFAGGPGGGGVFFGRPGGVGA